MVHNDEQRDTSQLKPKGTTIDNLGPKRNDDEIEWLDVEEPLDLVDTRLGRDMHIFVGNMSYIMDFTILENIETNIDPSLIPEPHCKTKRGVKNDIEPIAPTMTVNRLGLEWEERIRLHQEKEMEFNQ
ncbi:hypothetical protein Tco_1375941 [Tanacetum coccineum]